MINEYAMEYLVNDRLRELRAAAVDAALAEQVTRDRVSARAVLGQWLIRLGTRLLRPITA